MSKLFIVESPNKVKTIEKYLGDQYKVVASVGHIFELKTSGEHGLGIDLKTWTPSFKIDPKKKLVVQNLVKLAKQSDEIVLATDPDREGESIAQDIAEALKLEDNYSRVVFNEITQSAILDSIKNPIKLNQELINAQRTRRMLDRIIGFRLSKLMREKVKNSPASPSAGRVQSIALKLIVDLEKTINNFVSVPYSKISAFLSDSGMKVDFFSEKENIRVEGQKTWIKTDVANLIIQNLSGPLVVESVKKSQTTSKKSVPLEIDEVIKKANNRFSLSSHSVEGATQKLYELGLITYPRTDSQRFSASFIEAIKSYVLETYGDEYLDSTFFDSLKITKKNASKNIQDAHEAIRPTDMNLRPELVLNKFNLTTSEMNVYKIIYSETLKIAMKPSIYQTTSYVLANNGNKFSYSEKILSFKGFLAAGFDKSLENEKLLKLEEGQKLNASYEKGDFTTKPPLRYSDGSLVSMMKKIGVGRPSTYGTTVRTLLKRQFVQEVVGDDSNDDELLSDDGHRIVKGKKRLKPTDFGKVIYEKLLDFPKIFNESYTAYVEEELDKIATGSVDFKELLSTFYEAFDSQLQSVHQTMGITTLVALETGLKCQTCGGNLIYRTNKKSGNQFIGCSNYPKCKVAFPNIEAAQKGDTGVKLANVKCPNCGAEMVFKNNRKGVEFVACPNFPKCKTAFPNVESALTGVAPQKEVKKVDRKCPKCENGELIIKQGRFRKKEFIACSNFPKCRYAENIE